MKERLAALDPSDGVQEAVLLLGTDDDLFGGQVDMMRFYNNCMNLWADEIARHIDGDFVAFMSHGASIGGMWVCEYGPPYFYQLDAIVADIRKMLGPRNADVPIVLLVCNPWQHRITNDANVWYGEYNIFLLPDSAMPGFGHEDRRDSLLCGEVVIGKFSEFVRSAAK